MTADLRRGGLDLNLDRDVEREPLRDLDSGDLVVHYQPIVDLGRRTVIGVEAQVHWDHPHHGRLGPEAAVRLAEQTGAIGPLELWVLEQACRQVARWTSQGLRLTVAVNLSGAQVADPALVLQVRRVLDETGLDPGRLLLQFRESALADDRHPAGALDELATMGVRLGLGDFSTGHNSLLHLKRLPISVLKVADEFVAGLGTHYADEAIIETVASLASAVGGRCLATGVETAAQHAHLTALGCQAQGRLFAAPVAAEELPAAIDRARAVLLCAGRQTAADQPTVVDQLPPDVRQLVAELRRTGASQQTIAAALNQRAVPHPRGVRWHASSVARYLPDTTLRSGTRGSQ